MSKEIGIILGKVSVITNTIESTHKETLKENPDWSIYVSQLSSLSQSISDLKEYV